MKLKKNWLLHFCMFFFLFSGSVSALEYLPETSETYVSKNNSDIKYYSIDSCPKGKLMGRLHLDVRDYVRKVSVEDGLNSAINIAATKGADYVCYNTHSYGSFNPEITFFIYKNDISSIAKIVTVDSKPQGMYVKMAGQVLGKTPFSFTPDRSAFRLDAIPDGGGQCVQSETVNVEKSYAGLSKIKVFFNMYLCPINPSLSVDVN